MGNFITKAIFGPHTTKTYQFYEENKNSSFSCEHHANTLILYYCSYWEARERKKNNEKIKNSLFVVRAKVNSISTIAMVAIKVRSALYLHLASCFLHHSLSYLLTKSHFPFHHTLFPLQ